MTLPQTLDVSMLNISIGILAHNEADIIADTLTTLLDQTLFQASGVNLEVVVVPNGCTDTTAAIAQKTIATAQAQLPQAQLKVCEIQQAGLANAWNTYIHEFSNPAADYIFVMSADINLIEPRTLTSMVESLEAQPDAWVSVDQRLKDVAFKASKTPLDHLSVLASGLSGGRSKAGQPAWISGQLSCSRAKVLRQVWFPATLPTDDAFLYTLVVTNFLQESARPERVIQANAAAHTFEAYTHPKKLLKHEKWLIFGQAVNQILYPYLSEHQTDGRGLCDTIAQNNKVNSHWLNDLIRAQTQGTGQWFIPQFILVRRFKSLQNKSWYEALPMAPLCLLAFFIDLVLAIQVNHDLNRYGSLPTWTGSGSWGKDTAAPAAPVLGTAPGLLPAG
ncbi:MAG: glycosyltransferase [Cyanobacteria bacterium P01_A01_bin.105]